MLLLSKDAALIEVLNMILFCVETSCFKDAFIQSDVTGIPATVHTVIAP